MNTIHTSHCYECTADTSALVRSRMVSIIYALVAQRVEPTADVPSIMGRWFESSQARQFTFSDGSSHLSQLMPAGFLTASLAFF